MAATKDVPRRSGDFVEMTGRDGPVFILVSDIRRVIQKSDQTLVICEGGKNEFVEDRAEEVVRCIVTAEPIRTFREVKLQKEI